MMQDNFVDYGKEMLIANETQRKKIEFLQRQRIKRDHYLSDLQENLVINKETLRQYNQLGSNQTAIDSLTHETDLLIHKLKDYYQQYQSINASLLMQQQMRLSDRQFYEERLVEFENKMIDLRKYLHDKEESFTSVIVRLKKYQDLAEPTIDDKLHNFKKEIGERHINDFIADLIRQKNYYQKECQNMKRHYLAFAQMKNVVINRYEEVADILDKFEIENSVKISNLVGNLFHKQDDDKEKHKHKKVDPNAELIRLLKKEKLNNQLLEEALNDAIEKNEELVALKDLFQKNMENLESKCQLFKAENAIFALRLGEYDQHYCRTHSKKYYEQGQIKGLRYITEDRLKEYAKSVEIFFGKDSQLQKEFTQKMRRDVEKWGRMLYMASGVKNTLGRDNLLRKSSSVPRLIINFQLQEQESQLLIEQF